VYGVIDVVTRRFRYISAGHPPIMRLRPDEEPSFLKAGGFAIGWDADYEFDEYTVDLVPGDRLCIYSDGVPEALNSDLESFGNERFVGACRQTRTQDLQTAVADLLNRVEKWCGAAGPKDDVSILAVEIA
jgi:sigma-B regulation protein RsbU (phosphoserine phosphatase)